MLEIQGKGIFIYGDKAKDSVPVVWRLSEGKMLSNREPWRAKITIVNPPISQQVDVKILNAHDRDFIFKLKTDDGAVFLCGIYDIDHIIDAYPTLYLEICSPEQKMGKFSTVYST